MVSPLFELCRQRSRPLSVSAEQNLSRKVERKRAIDRPVDRDWREIVRKLHERLHRLQEKP